MTASLKLPGRLRFWFLHLEDRSQAFPLLWRAAANFVGGMLESIPLTGGELRIRHFDRNSYHGSPVGKIRVLAGSVLEIHTGYPETLSNGTKLAYTERTGEFTDKSAESPGAFALGCGHTASTPR